MVGAGAVITCVYYLSR